ncbi:hypothetical protein V565_098020 [Rhizoctonia solani 123E]|uniref:Uncharacterized protein n=1 Tax=Rhizoctonia solani 123E TaxID=1423351 RepID=A0A074RW62_9AGAM|nr:hypothetical protein V565_098020 [Rhizoctonia solani 123E]
MLTIQLVALEDGSAPRKLSPPHFLAWILFYYTVHAWNSLAERKAVRYDRASPANLLENMQHYQTGRCCAIIPHKQQGRRSLKKCIMKKGVFRPPGAYLSRLGWTLVL